MSNDDYVLYSLHMEKCGGTSVDRVYREVYGDTYYLYDPGPPQAHRDPEFPPGVRCVHGHMFYGLHEKLPERPHRYTTLLRDPVERFLSNFDHLRRFAHPLHQRAMQPDGLEMFCHDHDARHYRNLFVRRLSGSWNHTGQTELDKAESVLRSFDVVGRLEAAGAWVAACRDAFGWPDVTFGHFNAAPAGRQRFDQLSTAEQVMVWDCNALDIELMARVDDMIVS